MLIKSSVVGIRLEEKAIDWSVWGLKWVDSPHYDDSFWNTVYIDSEVSVVVSAPG